MESMGIALVWCMLQVTLLVVLAGIVYLVVRRYVPAAGALVTAATIGAVVVVSALAFSPWPRWQLATVEQATPVVTEEIDPVAPANHEPIISAPLEIPMAEAEPVAAEFDWALMLQALGEQLRVEPTIETDGSRRWPTYLAIGLILIACVGIIRLLLGLSSMRKFRRLSRAVDDSEINELVDVLRAELGYSRSIELRELDCVTTAATIGWRRPVILLPSEWTDWNDAQRRAVLAHEIAHVRSGDYLVHLLAQISLVFHFYHPLVHWLVARLRLEQELAADAMAARLAGGQTAYLKTLAEMALRQSDESLGWPARTFLPTRGTFLRRIEMLRDSKSLLTTAPKSARWLSAGSILMIGLLAVGIRGPGVEEVVAAPVEDKPQVEEAPTKSDGRFSLDYVPADAIAVVSIRPAEILGQPDVLPQAAKLDELFQSLNIVKNSGLPHSGIEEVTFAVVDPTENPRIIVHTVRDTDKESFFPLGRDINKLKEFAGHKFIVSARRRTQGYFFADATTVVIDSVAGLRLAAIAASGQQRGPKWAPIWSKSSKGQLNCLINVAKVRALIEDEPVPLAMKAFSPIWEHSRWIAISGSLIGELRLQGTHYCSTPVESGEVISTIQAAVTLAKNSLGPLLRQTSAKGSSESALAMLSILQLGEQLLESAEFAHGEDNTAIWTVGKSDAFKTAVLLQRSLVPAIKSARESARRAQSMNNLKQIALALHMYHDTHRHLPPPVLYGPDGKTPYSWRVALLPFLGQKALYNQYRLNEPWDSEHNRLLIAKIPSALHDPSNNHPIGNTSYFTLVGKDTMFPGDGKEIGFKDVIDGLSKTFAVFEARRDIPWTKPEDITYDAEKPLPKFGGFYDDAFHVAFGDGSVHKIKQGVDQDVLRPYITISDRKRVRPLP